MHRLTYWGLFGLTLAVYALMLGWSLPTVSAAAGGLAPFDMRPGGYSHAEAMAFLSALTADGARFYLDVQQRLDIVYPALIALTLFFSIAAMAPRRLGRWRWALAIVALPIAIFDYLENHAIALMIAAGPRGLTPELVAEASRWTVLKSGTTTIAMVILLGLVAIKTAQRLLRLWRSRSATGPSSGATPP